MRKKLSILIAVIYVLQFFHPPLVQAGALSSFSQLSAQADPHTGSANFGIPIEVAQGRGGIQPNLQISYNSSSPNGIFGVGWGLELGSVKRSTKKGPPKYDATDSFFLSHNGGVEELIFDSTANLYRSKIEGSFLKIQQTSNYWIVTDKSGTKYYFGQTAASQEFDPNNTARISEWAIDRVEDINGNYMTYQYVKDGNTLYPYRINYTGHVGTSAQPFHYVEFVKEARPDGGFDQYLNSYAQRLNYRINQIKVYAAGNIQRSYSFNYIVSSSTGRSLISKVIQYAADGTTALPPIEFAYQDAKDTAGNSHQVIKFVNQLGTGDHLWNYRQDTSYDRGHDTYGPCPPYDMCKGVNWGPQTLVGDGTGSFSMSSGNDIAHWYWTYVYMNKARTINVPIQTFENPYGVWINGNYSTVYQTSWPLNQGWNLVEITMYHQHQSIAFNLNYALASDPDVGYMGSTQAVLGQIYGDYNADGYTDIATYDQTAGKINVSLSTGSGFQPSSTWLTGISSSDKMIAGDFNGDGKQDFGFVDSSGNWKVSLSEGTKFAAQVLWIDSPWGGSTNQYSSVDFNNDGYSDALRFFDNGGTLSAQVNFNNGTKFAAGTSQIVPISPSSGFQAFSADFNGDGLIDFGSFNKSTGQWMFKINPGNNSAAFIDLPSITDTDVINRSIIVADFNADGKTDIGYYDNRSGLTYYRLSNGSGFETQLTSTFTFANRDSQAQVQAADINGDTIADFVSSAATGSSEIAYSNGQAPDLLYQVKNGVGAVSTITYGPVAKFLNTTLPFPIQVVRLVKISNSMGQEYLTQYSYEKGVWSTTDREFRGFGLVKSFDPENNYSETEFYQDDIYKGRIKEQRTYDENGKLYNKVVYTWSTPQVIAAGVNFIFLKRKDNFVYDGDATGRRTAEEFFYEETPQVGNLTKTIQYGEVDLSTGNDIGTDSRTLETQYVNNTTNWILGLPKLTTVKDGSGAFVRKTWFSYDNLANGSTPTKGLLTKKENWGGDQVGAQKPTTKYSYDVYGNLKTTTDPRNYVTTINYDSTYNLFPLTTINALNFQIQNEYYGINAVPLDSGDGFKGLWGQLKSTTDPNNQKGKRTYDMFGRPTASVSPVDSITYPTAKSEYLLSNPLSLLTSRALVKTGQARTIDSFDCYDGLGRLVMNKRYGPEPNQYIVSGLTKYNSRGLPERQFLPYYSDKPLNVAEIVSPATPNTLTEYDPMGRVVKATNPDGTYSTAQYKDWTTVSIDENGHKQESDFDAYGRLIQKREYLGADGRSPNYPASAYALYATTNYKYDSEGNLIETKDHFNHLTTIAYDVLGRKIQMNDPDMGIWKYEYDVNGNLTKQTDAKGKSILFTYDALNRLTNKTDQAALNVNYTYDDNAVLNSKGRLTKAAYPTNGVANFNYDKMGREIKSQKQIDSLVYNVDRNYEALNQLTDVTYPDTAKVYYEYNLAGQVMSAANDASLLPNPGNPGGDPTLPKLLTIETPYVHYKMDDNAATADVKDDGTGGISGTSNTNTSNLSSTGKVSSGKSFNFNGSYRLDMPNLGMQIKNDKVGTVSFWLKPNTGNSVDQIFSLGSSTKDTHFVFRILYGKMNVLSQLNGGLVIQATGTTVLNTGSWYHVVYVQNGAFLKLYVNGVEEVLTIADQSDMSAWIGNANVSGQLDRFIIGGSNSAGTGNTFANSNVDDFRYYKRALNNDEVQAIYNGGNGTEDNQVVYEAKPRTIETPYVHYKMNDNAAATTVADTGTGATPATASVNTSALTSAGKIGTGFHFDGISQKLNVDALINKLKNDQVGTFSFWFKSDENDVGEFFSFTSSTSSDAFQIQLCPNDQIYVYLGDNQSAHFYYWTNVPFLHNQWYHIAVVQDKLGLRFYSNGVLLPGAYQYNSDTLGWLKDQNKETWNKARIGNHYGYNLGGEDANYYFKGSIDDFRYYKRGLTEAEVKALYNNGNGTEDDVVTYTP